MKVEYDKLLSVKLPIAYPRELDLSRVDMSHLPRPVRHTMSAEYAMAQMVRKSQVYIVDFDDASNAMHEAIAGNAQELHLPPLPFETIVIEGHNDMGWGMSYPDGRHAKAYVDMFWIGEIDQGREWRVCTLLRKSVDRNTGLLPDGFKYFKTIDCYRLRPDTGMTFLEFKGGRPDGFSWYPSQPDRAIAIQSSHAPIELVNLITANGTSIERFAPIRQQRRAWERKHKQAFPKLNIVVIGGANSPNEIDGDTGRVYTHRWRVRGHWRNYQDGKRTWVRPYVKGPAGAPWITQIRVKPAA